MDRKVVMDEVIITVNRWQGFEKILSSPPPFISKAHLLACLLGTLLVELGTMDKAYLPISHFFPPLFSGMREGTHTKGKGFC